MSDTVKISNICLIEIPERRESGTEVILRYFSELIKDMNLQSQETQQIPSRRHRKIPTLRFNIVKC